MRELVKYSYQLNYNFTLPFGNHLPALRGYEDILIPQCKPFFSSRGALYGQEAYLELYPRDPSCQIGRETQTYMGHDILYPSHSGLLELMPFLEDTIESLDDRYLLVIETGEGFTVLDGPHSIQSLIILFEVEDRSVWGFPADGTEQTLLGFLQVEATAKFESISFRFSSPVSQLELCFAGILPVCSNDDISSLDGVFSPPWVFRDERDNLILGQVACILSRIISCISDDGLDLFIYGLEVFLRFFGQFFEKISIPFISWKYLNSQKDRKLCIGDLEMDLGSKEAEVFAFSALGSIRIRFFGFAGRGVDGESKVFFLDEAEGLSDEIHDDLREGFLTESLSEVMEGVVVGGISIGENIEVRESFVLAEFPGEVSFRGGVAEVEEQKGFEEVHRVMTFSPLLGVFLLGKAADEGEGDLLVEDFQGGIRWDKTGDFGIDETELFLSFNFDLLC